MGFLFYSIDLGVLIYMAGDENKIIPKMANQLFYQTYQLPEIKMMWLIIFLH